eukprot:XP_022260009.1 uncharacterized protein C7orf73 homolog [Canis lupus familiaris]
MLQFLVSGDSGLRGRACVGPASAVARGGGAGAAPRPVVPPCAVLGSPGGRAGLCGAPRVPPRPRVAALGGLGPAPTPRAGLRARRRVSRGIARWRFAEGSPDVIPKSVLSCTLLCLRNATLPSLPTSDSGQDAGVPLRFQLGFTFGNVVGMYLAQNYDIPNVAKKLEEIKKDLDAKKKPPSS